MNKLTDNKDKARWLKYTLDILADELHGEFGYDTCKEDEKLNVLEELFNQHLID